MVEHSSELPFLHCEAVMSDVSLLHQKFSKNIIHSILNLFTDENFDKYWPGIPYVPLT